MESQVAFAAHIETHIVVLILSALAFASAMPTISKKPFGKTAGGQRVYLYTLKNRHGMEVAIPN